MGLVRPLEERGVVPPGWIDSVVMNEYYTGSSIVGHVDPPQLFARPIVTASFFCPARLVFGASFDPERRVPPVYSQYLPPGCVMVFDGYAANRVTHGIRPEDLLGHRRVSIVFRHAIKESLEATNYFPRPVSDVTEVTMTLLRLVQGWWCNPPALGSQMYYVCNRLITIYDFKEKCPTQRTVWNLPSTRFWSGVAECQSGGCCLDKCLSTAAHGIAALAGKRPVATLEL